MITRGELGMDAAMNLAVDSARDIAGADGVAICLVDGDQVIYRAASGCSAACVGTRLRASLTVPTNARVNGEILRVENAQTDTRIQAAICRQFGAKSLLILPIYQERILAGVLEVLFTEAHAFQDSEVHSYRLMAGLIEAALSYAAVAERNPCAEEVPEAEESPYAFPVFLVDDESLLEKTQRAIHHHYGAAYRAVKKSRFLPRPTRVGPTVMHRARAAAMQNPPWKFALASAAVLGVALWVAHSRGPASPRRASAPADSTLLDPPDPRTARSVTVRRVNRAPNAALPLQKARLSGGMVRRVRRGSSEIDYIGDDVTVRRFITKANTQRPIAASGRVANIGDDVTVRYFPAKPAVTSDSR